MSSVVFPDESKMSKSKMEDINKSLLKYINQQKYCSKDIEKKKKKGR